MLTITFLSLLGLVLLFLGFAGKVGLVKNLAALGVLASLGILLFANQDALVPAGMETQLLFDANSLKFSALILGFSVFIIIQSIGIFTFLTAEAYVKSVQQ